MGWALSHQPLTKKMPLSQNLQRDFLNWGSRLSDDSSLWQDDMTLAGTWVNQYWHLYKGTLQHSGAAGAQIYTLHHRRPHTKHSLERKTESSIWQPLQEFLKCSRLSKTQFVASWSWGNLHRKLSQKWTQYSDKRAPRPRKTRARSSASLVGWGQAWGYNIFAHTPHTPSRVSLHTDLLLTPYPRIPGFVHAPWQAVPLKRLPLQKNGLMEIIHNRN